MLAGFISLPVVPRSPAGPLVVDRFSRPSAKGSPPLRRPVTQASRCWNRLGAHVPSLHRCPWASPGYLTGCALRTQRLHSPPPLSTENPSGRALGTSRMGLLTSVRNKGVGPFRQKWIAPPGNSYPASNASERGMLHGRGQIYICPHRGGGDASPYNGPAAAQSNGWGEYRPATPSTRRPAHGASGMRRGAGARGWTTCRTLNRTVWEQA